MRYLSYQIIFFLFTISIFAQSPHGDTFDIDCSECHNADSWKIDLKKISFDHSKTNFALIGQHINVDCKSCHTSLVFSKMDKDCFSCHKDIHQSTVGVDCASCHTPSTWVVKDIVGLHQKERFPLLGAHRMADCAQCHSGYTELKFEPIDIDCYACHKQNYESTQNPNHVTANFSTECQDCHNISALSWKSTNIDHSFFPLVGGHALPSCFSCHQQGGNFSGLSQECYSCHQQTFVNTTKTNHITIGIPTTCEDCHTISSWSPSNFNHATTGFELLGLHQPLQCSSCHTGAVLNSECYACHQQDYQGTQNPNHITAGIPTTCEVCHSSNGWSPAQFNHNLTEFPLTGKHIDTDCASCHSTGYTGTPTDCYACHQQDYQSANDPNHVASQFPTDCNLCHSTSGWDDATFDHNLSSFALTGSHITVACASCHTSGYAGTPTDCFACHTTDFNSTTNPNHVTGNFPTTCVSCHTTTAWQPATFDHNTTQFPLTGAHTTTTCQSCHTTGYTNTPTDCFACHTTDYNNTTNPNHTTISFPTTCVDCHSTTAWQPATFDHDNQYFPIYSGKHNGEWNQCSECHTTPNNYSLFSCIDCHEHRQSEMDTKHQGVNGYNYNSLDCFACHPQGNSEGAFNHATSSFPLTGLHQTANCIDCHQNGYLGTSSLCSDCHITSYNNSANPNHTAAGISTECSTCHNANGWTPSTFDHSSTGFTLLGSHQPLQCSSCHIGTTTGLTNDCLPCHQTDYNTAANHITQSYPTNCELCHNSVNWNESTFNHQNTSFPLTGAHITTTCQSCHATGYTGTSTDCYACHTTDYNNTTNPNHTSVSFPTTCVDCHSTTAWEPATFDHDNQYFPIYSGKHNGEWNQCSECHTTPNNYSLFSCIDCHEHRQSEMDSEHQGVQGYNYNSLDCFACHPQGNGDGAFNHATSSFPLTGLHQTANCIDCHQNGYLGTSSLCSDCHITSYNNSANPNHTAAGISTECSTCHNANGWTPSTFDHSSTGFTLLGSHQPLQCSSCHVGTTSGLTNDCLPCHQTDYNTAANHTTQSYPTNCELCHNSVNWNETTFDHQNTSFPLTGAHITTDCQSCHTTGYTGTSTDCYACHTTDFNNSTNPNHVAGNYPTTCVSCHSTAAWQPATFDHNTTQFPLTGAHTTASCQSCHATGYTGTSTDCYACHTTDFNNTTNPNHVTANFPTACVDCHSTTAWQPATFDHSQTQFPLTGAHITTTCQSCHATGYTNTPTDCYACHTTDYNNTTNPNHIAANFPTTCIDCHSTTAWEPATFDHDNQYFPIYSGEHNGEWNQCSECHTTPNDYSLFSCIDCHEHRQSEMDSEHQGVNGYVYNSINCYDCHPDGRERPVNFNHSMTEFPLTGAHINVDCAQCHSTKSQNRLSTDCVDCHKQDYLKSLNPNHQASGISTDCISCHNTNNWNSGIKLLENNKVF